MRKQGFSLIFECRRSLIARKEKPLDRADELTAKRDLATTQVVAFSRSALGQGASVWEPLPALRATSPAGRLCIGQPCRRICEKRVISTFAKRTNRPNCVLYVSLPAGEVAQSAGRGSHFTALSQLVYKQKRNTPRVILSGENIPCGCFRSRTFKNLQKIADF